MSSRNANERRRRRLESARRRKTCRTAPVSRAAPFCVQPSAKSAVQSSSEEATATISEGRRHLPHVVVKPPRTAWMLGVDIGARVALPGEWASLVRNDGRPKDGRPVGRNRRRNRHVRSARRIVRHRGRDRVGRYFVGCVARAGVLDLAWNGAASVTNDRRALASGRYRRSRSRHRTGRSRHLA